MPSSETSNQASQPDSLADAKDELTVALLARQELGKELEDEVIESFLSRVEDAIDARVEARVRESLRDMPTRRRLAAPSTGRVAITLFFVTAFLIFTIPLADFVGSGVAMISFIACLVFAAVTLVLPEKDAPTELASGKSHGIRTEK